MEREGGRKERERELLERQCSHILVMATAGCRGRIPREVDAPRVPFLPISPPNFHIPLGLLGLQNLL